MSEPWRPARTREEALDRAIKSMVPGSWQGKVAQAMPVKFRDTEQVESLDEEFWADIEAAVQGWQDRAVASGTGAILVRLTYEPIAHTEHVYWHPAGGAGLYLEGARWYRDDKDIVVVDDGSVEAGDVVTVEYLHLEAVIPPDPARVPVAPEYVAYRSLKANGTTLAYPTGTVAGDLVVVGLLSGWDLNETVSDSRMTKVWTEVRGDRRAEVYVGQASDVGTPLAVNVTEGSGSTSEMAIITAVTFRGAGGETLQHKAGAVAGTSSDGWVEGGASTSKQIPGLPDTDLSGAVCMFIANDGTGGVYGDQDWGKCPAYSLKVADDDSYIEIDAALTTTVPVPAQTTPNTDYSSSGQWTAVVVGVY